MLEHKEIILISVPTIISLAAILITAMGSKKTANISDINILHNRISELEGRVSECEAAKSELMQENVKLLRIAVGIDKSNAKMTKKLLKSNRYKNNTKIVGRNKNV